jgi:hypothetical protein
MNRCQRISVAMSVVALMAIVFAHSPARPEELTADDVAKLKHLLQPKFLVAEVIEAAGLAAERCPGFHVIEDNIEAEFRSAGGSESDVYSPEFKAMSARGRANAAVGYEPPRVCRRPFGLSYAAMADCSSMA